MKKSAELAHLRKLISVLGPDSYIGPWLSSVAANIESDLRSDHYQMITIPDYKAHCDELIAEANKQAADIIARAQTQAGQILNRADEAESRAASNLRDALRALQS